MILVLIASIALNILATKSLFVSASRLDVEGGTVAWIMCTPLLVLTIVQFSPISGFLGTLYFYASPIYLLATLTILAALALIRRTRGFSRLAPWVIMLGLVSHAITMGSWSSVIKPSPQPPLASAEGF